MEKALKHLSFGSLLDGFKQAIGRATDEREAKKTEYSLEDAVVSAFACMYFQEPSLLQFQRRMQEEQQRNNLQTIFGVKQIPKDTQLRSLLDEFDPEHFADVFNDYFLRLQRGKHLEQYQFLGSSYLVLLDATQYFCSEHLCCDHCLTTKEDEEVVRYAHKVLQLAVVRPGIKQVIPLMPEEIRNTDGSSKQDCEYNAAKRALERLRREHPQLDIILVGDGLYSKQPMIERAMRKRMHYIFVAKPDDHKALMEYVKRSDEVKEKRWSNKEHTYVYHWLNDAPLKGSDDALSVNYFSLTILRTNEKGETEVTYKNSWVTDLVVDEHNIDDLVKAGRARWKIENECFNTLKNQGYSIEHNYGHGSQHLCLNFYLLIVTAFTFHQIFELTDDLFQACRQKAGSKRYLWEELRGIARWFLVESWEFLLQMFLGQIRFISVRASP